MSSGSAPTVLASTSEVSTSHSLSRLGYLSAELFRAKGRYRLHRGAVDGVGATGQQRGGEQCGGQTGGRTAAHRMAPFLRVHRLAGQLFGHVTGWRIGLLREADRPFDEVVVELDRDLAEVVPSIGSVPTATQPSWPSMLMSSTLVRVSSSVLRSAPDGLPRNQVKEKCGPRMPPPASHWHPTELTAVLTRPSPGSARRGSGR